MRALKAVTSFCIPHSLISAFGIRYLESFVVRSVPCIILMLYLVTVAEQTGLDLTLFETQHKLLVRRCPIIIIKQL